MVFFLLSTFTLAETPKLPKLERNYLAQTMNKQWQFLLESCAYNYLLWSSTHTAWWRYCSRHYHCSEWQWAFLYRHKRRNRGMEWYPLRSSIWTILVRAYCTRRHNNIYPHHTSRLKLESSLGSRHAWCSEGKGPQWQYITTVTTQGTTPHGQGERFTNLDSTCSYNLLWRLLFPGVVSQPQTRCIQTGHGI